MKRTKVGLGGNGANLYKVVRVGLSNKVAFRVPL